MRVNSKDKNPAAKSKDARLQASEIRYRRLFETAKDGILLMDFESGRITDANPFMCQLLGYSHGDFVDKELWEIGLFADIEASRAAFAELKAKKYIRYEHMPLATQDGRQVEVEFVSNVYDEAGQMVIQCNIRDITQRRVLERRASEQAAALADLHLRKDEFLAMLSHELRNPLASMASAVHLLRLQKEENPIQVKARGTIERQVGLLTRMVDDLLEVSRITSGRIRLRREAILVNGVLERAIETVRPLLNQRRHTLSVSLSSGPIWLYADAGRIEQVVVNLLTNAAKYMDDGGRLWLSVRQEGQQCLMVVRDEGTGMTPELLPHVFDLFVQADRSLGRSEGGLGIGLAVVHRLVEMHGGTVTVNSVLGRGSEFLVSLPVGAPPEEESIPDVPQSKGPHSNSVRVLVVDDNVDVGETFALLLQEDGYEARAVFDGPAALAAALEFAPHVVLLDIGMPGWDGYEVARRMREDPQLQAMTLVALTGYGQESDRRRSLEAGFAHHLIKPVSLEEVTRILTTASPAPRNDDAHYPISTHP